MQQVVDALAPHGLTLQNYASISEQQLGGFLQVLFVCVDSLHAGVAFCRTVAHEAAQFQGLSIGDNAANFLKGTRVNASMVQLNSIAP